jgi:hypothetical protein
VCKLHTQCLACLDSDKGKHTISGLNGSSGVTIGCTEESTTTTGLGGFTERQPHEFFFVPVNSQKMYVARALRVNRTRPSYRACSTVPTDSVHVSLSLPPFFLQPEIPF